MNNEINNNNKLDTAVDKLFEVKTFFNEIKNPILILNGLLYVKPENIIKIENCFEDLILNV